MSDLMTVREFADASGIPQRTVYTYCRQGLIEFIAIGARSIVLRRETVAAARATYRARCAVNAGRGGAALRDALKSESSAAA